MKPDQLQPGQEQHEEFISTISKRTLIQYDYRATDGTLFSCVAKTLEAAHARRDEWLAAKQTGVLVFKSPRG